MGWTVVGWDVCCGCRTRRGQGSVEGEECPLVDDHHCMT